MNLRELYRRLASGRGRRGGDEPVVARNARGERFRLDGSSSRGAAIARPSRVRAVGVWSGDVEITFEVDGCIEALVLTLRESDAHRLRLLDPTGRVRVQARVAIGQVTGEGILAASPGAGAAPLTRFPLSHSGDITASTGVVPMAASSPGSLMRSTLPLAMKPVATGRPQLALVPAEPVSALEPWARGVDVLVPGRRLGVLHFDNASALVGVAHPQLAPFANFLERHLVVRDHAELLRGEAPASRGGGMVLQLRPAEGVVALRERDAWVDVSGPRQLAVGQEFSLGDAGFVLHADGELEFTRVVKHQARAQSARFQKVNVLRGRLFDGLSLFGRNVALEGHLTLPIPVAGSHHEREIIVWDMGADERLRRLLQTAVARAHDPKLRQSPRVDRAGFERAVERALRILRDLAHAEFGMPRRERARANLKKRLPTWRGKRVLVGEVLAADAAFCSHLSLLAQAFLCEVGLEAVELRRGHAPGGEAHQWNQLAIDGEPRVIEFASYYYCTIPSPLVSAEASRAYRRETVVVELRAT